ncbi:MAG: hypothetical protein JW791_04955 [Nanoarchaeota archaeon]|nr:hypothetical protein [Nanoarchaeota archaeon]
MAALCYLWIVGPIMLFIEKKDEFVRFHAKQATGLFLLSFIPLLNLIVLVLNIIGLIMALQGKKFTIPLVNELGVWVAKLLGQK